MSSESTSPIAPTSAPVTVVTRPVKAIKHCPPLIAPTPVTDTAKSVPVVHIQATASYTDISSSIYEVRYTEGARASRFVPWGNVVEKEVDLVLDQR